jgi:hypothetical protein
VEAGPTREVDHIRTQLAMVQELVLQDRASGDGARTFISRAPERAIRRVVKKSWECEIALCPCCGSEWRLEADGFALRPGRIREEWT